MKVRDFTHNLKIVCDTLQNLCEGYALLHCVYVFVCNIWPNLWNKYNCSYPLYHHIVGSNFEKVDKIRKNEDLIWGFGREMFDLYNWEVKQRKLPLI